MLRSLDSSTGEDIIIFDFDEDSRVIEEIREKSRNGVIICPECDQPVVVKAGTKKRNHFAHRALGTCPLSSESANVLQGRKLLYEWLSKKLSSKYPDNHELVLEKTFPCEELRRPTDCYLELPNGKKFAYLILDSGIRSFGDIKQFFHYMEIPLVRIFLGNMIRLDQEKEVLRLTPTERESITWEDMSLSYLDIESGKFTTFGGLKLHHSPQEFKFVYSISHKLSDMLISPKTGKLVHPDTQYKFSNYGNAIQTERGQEKIRNKIEQADIDSKKGFCFKCGIKILPNTPSMTFNSGKTLCRKCIVGGQNEPIQSLFGTNI